MKKVFVTGAGGWLGAEVVRTLLARADQVIATDLAITPALDALGRQYSGLTCAAADLGEWQQVLQLLCEHRPDAVIHCAALVGVAACADVPFKAYRVNVEGALNLFEAMRQAQVKRVIHVSTEETYGDFLQDVIDEDHPQNPLSFYGTTKLAVEHAGRVYSRDHGLECINVRTCWVYGPHLPRLRVPRTFVEAALRGEPLHQPDGADFAVDQVYISDTVAGIILALDKVAHQYDAYNVATGVASTMLQVADAVNCAVPGARISVASTGPYLHGGTVLSARKGALNIQRAVRELGYSPRYSLQQGIDATVAATRAEFERRNLSLQEAT